ASTWRTKRSAPCCRCPSRRARWPNASSTSLSPAAVGTTSRPWACVPPAGCAHPALRTKETDMPTLARPRFLLELALALGACGGVEEPSAPLGVAVRATAAFDLGDDHIDADAAVLAIDRIELVPRSGDVVVL